MVKNSVLEKITNAIVRLDRQSTVQFCEEAVTSSPPEDVIDALSKGLSIIGAKFETREYFLYILRVPCWKLQFQVFGLQLLKVCH